LSLCAERPMNHDGAGTISLCSLIAASDASKADLRAGFSSSVYTLAYSAAYCSKAKR